MPEFFKGSPDSRREKDKDQPLELSAKFIEQFFTSPDFEATFKKTLDLVGKHGRELGFSMLKDLNSEEIVVTKPIGGEKEGETDLRAGIDELRNLKKYIGKEFISFCSLHFHNKFPREDTVLNPSINDLETFNRQRKAFFLLTGFDIPPIMIIALRTYNKNARLLIFREPEARPLTPEILEDLGTALFEAKENDDSQKEIVKLLENYGYKVVFIPNFSGKFSEKDLELLKSFAFIPKSKKIIDE